PPRARAQEESEQAERRERAEADRQPAQHGAVAHCEEPLARVVAELPVRPEEPQLPERKARRGRRLGSDPAPGLARVVPRDLGREERPSLLELREPDRVLVAAPPVRARPRDD